MFVNRTEELAFLEEKYREKDAQMVVIYGRRRVGKTELILQFLKGKRHVFFLASRSNAKELLNQFLQSASSCLKDMSFTEIKPDWELAFKRIAALNERVVVVIDELPYVLDADPAFSSILQRIWDLHLANSNVFLILNGSSITMMESEVLAYKSPLYGRRSGQWKVEPLKFSHIRKFFPKYSTEELVEAYSVLGGIPFYLNKFDAGKGVLENVGEKILRKGEVLFGEAEFLLREELREPRQYFMLLKAISQGNTKVGNIMNATGMDKATVSKYIDTLIRLKFVKREVPVTEKNPDKSKKGLYFISDNYLRFWFRFVLPNVSRVEENPAEALEKIVKPNFPQFVSFAFEQVCAEFLQEQNKNGKAPIEFDRIGKWWSGGEEIDIAATNSKTKELLLAECKWTNKEVDTGDAKALVEKSGKVEWFSKSRKHALALFSKSGFTDGCRRYCKENGIVLYDLEAIARDLA